MGLLMQAGIVPQPYDHVLVNGVLLPIDQPVSKSDFIQLQLRHAFPLTVNTPQGQQVIQSAALTVGDALHEAGLEIYTGDRFDPPLSTPITGPLTVTVFPSREMLIYVGENVIKTRSSAGTVGGVLAEAGIPLTGEDISFPAESEAPPPDGQIRVVRVYETVEVTLQPIPFETEKVFSKEIPLGQKEVTQTGINGLSMIRTRIRYEDGVEVDRNTESETVLREPVKEIVASGEEIVLSTVPSAGAIPYEYWTAVSMYATTYSPCDLGTGGCSYATSSGARAGHGIVAVDPVVYGYLAGTQVYVPGYGVGTIGDIGGGYIIEANLGVPRTQWIDLGYNEGESKDISGWVTVYFLAPAPAEIPYFMK